MSTGLVLPRHTYVAEQRRKAGLRDEAVAANIAKSSHHRMDSDDFVTREDVAFQLHLLNGYIQARLSEDPDYHLPKPVGWRMQLLMLTIPDVSSGGVIVPDEAREQRSMASPQGVVLAMGGGCYKDPARFKLDGKLEPWCAVGDRVQLVKYDAQFYQIANGQRLGVVTDTQPVAVIDSGWEVPA